MGTGKQQPAERKPTENRPVDKNLRRQNFVTDAQQQVGELKASVKRYSKDLRPQKLAALDIGRASRVNKLAY